MLVRNNVRPRSQRMRRTDRLAGRRKPAPRKRSLARFVRLLRAHLPEISERYQVKSLGVFGSYVRGAQKPRSDLDILVEYADGETLPHGSRLQVYLCELLDVKIDLVPRPWLKPFIGKRILGEVIWLQRDGMATNVQVRSRKPNGKKGATVSKPAREYLDFLNDIVTGMDEALQLVVAMSFQDLVNDRRTVLATAKVIENIGEAVKHLPPDVKKRYPHLPRKDIAGMRDKLVHDYFAINYEKLWEALTVSIPRDKPLVAQALDEELQRRREQETQQDKPPTY